MLIPIDDFARWALRDINSNLKRSLLSEYVVNRALDLEPGGHVEWGAYDIQYGYTEIEVKSSGFGTPPFSKTKKPHLPRFDIRQRQGSWSGEAGAWQTYKTLRRPSHVYIFAVTHGTCAQTFMPLDTDHWSFAVASTAKIDERYGSQKTIGWSEVTRSFGFCRFANLRSMLDRVLEQTE